MVTYSGASLQEVWYSILRDLLRLGTSSAPRGLATAEIAPAAITLTDPTASVITDSSRRLNQAFAAAEFCWVMAGDDTAAKLSRFNSRIAQFADQDGGARFFGAYGPKVAGQLPYVLEALRREDSRQAVISIWRESPPPTRDVPCTLSLQFLLRRGRLSLIVTMRSNDVWLGLPYDAQLFTRIQVWVASQLGCELGQYYHVAGSLHLYATDFVAAARVLQVKCVSRPGRISSQFAVKTLASSVWDSIDDFDVRLMDFGDGWNDLRDVMTGYLERKAAK